MRTSPLVALLVRVTRLAGVLSAEIATRDGLPVALSGAALEGGEMRAATAAALFGAVDRALPGIGLGGLEATTVETSEYTLYLRAAHSLVLTAVARRGSDRAAILAEMERVANVLARVDRAQKER